MTVLLAAGVVAQGLDAMTMRFEHELNPLVVSLGSGAYLAKIAMLVLAVIVAWASPRLATDRHLGLRRAAAAGISGLLLVAGAFGTWSNL